MYQNHNRRKLGKTPKCATRLTGCGDQLERCYNRKYTVRRQKVEETTWFRVSVWGKQAETCNQYLKRQQGAHEGRLQADKATGGRALDPAGWHRWLFIRNHG